MYSVRGKEVRAILFSKSKIRKRQNYSNNKQRSGCQAWMGGEGWKDGTQENVGQGNFCMIL